MRPSSSASEPSEPGSDLGAPGEPAGLFDEVLARGAVRAATGDRAWLQALLDAEAALALARADCGLTSVERAERVAAACRAERFDVAALAREAAAGGNPVIPLVHALSELVAADGRPGSTARTAAVPGAADHGAAGGAHQRQSDGGASDDGAADEVHRGATSQDILDTAAMLVVRRSFDALLGDLERAATRAAELARTHRDTPMAGRTLLQQATPTTLGAKAAGWLTALDDSIERLVDLRTRRLAVQLGGATGTLLGFEGRGVDVVERFAARLGLAAPVVPWHTDRSRIAEVGAALAVAAGAAGKVALDVVLLAQTEVAEVAEHDEDAPRRGGSSAMPHKRNPVAAILTRAAAAAAPGLTATLLSTMAQEHERAAGAWHAEWRPLAELLRAAGSAAAWLADCLTHVRVDVARLRRNLELSGDLVAGERLVAVLAPALGRRPAHELVAELSRRAAAEGRPLAALLGDDPRTRPHLPPQRLATVLDTTTDLGMAGTLVDRALARHDGRPPLPR